MHYIIVIHYIIIVKDNIHESTWLFADSRNSLLYSSVLLNNPMIVSQYINICVV